MNRIRIGDWLSVLYQKLEEPVELVYGTSDCFLHSCDIVLALTGVDYADEIRGTYHSEEEADAKLKEYGGISGYLTHRIGEPLPSPHAACMGDFVLIEQDGNESLGVCTGAVGAFIRHPPDKGMRSVRLTHCTKAWRS